ncbi:MAG: glycosyltransferase [Planctomycetales bacterium]|nr:glycosyltransferase [Planctomycetales bacterium]NIM09996.1 glycosyltransferase [Planctomycetales bacterium]NIN09436.1 glycosyltransferase [Planctomycetales bacterium]NIN78545.1 glycosyltransferase [Planctomycetales bacterium]NIO35737.1 glycosyltransferase [Planctomycetales bacterium]
MSESPLKIVYLTPGAGGMYCGSCLSDNMLVAATRRLGHTAWLVPLYTPIRTDEPNQSGDELFFGGINVYLQQKIPFFRLLPQAMDRWLDRPGLVGKLAGRASAFDARKLGALTLSMVRGEQGNQRKEVHRLVDWLTAGPACDVIHLGNLLIAGCVPLLKSRLNAKIVVTLQGDDLFIEQLPGSYREPVRQQLSEVATGIDGFIVHTQFYADAMSEYFGIDRDRIEVVPLSISLDDMPPVREARAEDRPLTVGYLARVCPAKGLHQLVDAFLDLKSRPGMEGLHLEVGGWLSGSEEAYFAEQQSRITAAGWAGDFRYAGVLSWEEKWSFLRGLDLFSVPATYAEPKGRYVLEALAAGVPVVQPRQGAFPELLRRTGGGCLFPPGDARQLADSLHQLLVDPQRRRELGERGRAGVKAECHAGLAAQRTIAIYRKYLAQRG